MFYLDLIFNTLPRLAVTLGSSIFGAMNLYVRIAFFLFFKKIHKDNTPWLFSGVYEGKIFSMHLFEGSPDIAALKEIFLDGEYDWKEMQDPQIIIDLGAHTGNTALYFHLKYPNALIYAVEASPKTYERLLKNVKNIAHIKPVFGAVSDSDGELTFYESESSLGSSLIERSGSKGVQVPCFTIATLFKNIGVARADLIKIDIEGAEERIFSDGMLPHAFSRSYMIEVHEDLMSEKNFVEKYFSSFCTTTRKLEFPSRYLLYAVKENNI